MRLRSLPALTRHHGIALASDLMTCLRFFTRLPLPPLHFEPSEWESGTFGRALRAAPLAGLAIGMAGASVLVFGYRGLGLPAGIAAMLALGAQILLSGALHEDGLADVADGFGGGAGRQRKLDIMRDSRLGTFGVLALILFTGLRIGAAMALIDRDGLAAAAFAILAAAAVSRGVCLLPLAVLPPARSDGLGGAAALIPAGSLATALALAVFLGTTLAFAGGLPEAQALGACGAALLAGFVMTQLARWQIGGQTGDVAGATQQTAEIAFLLAFLVAPGLD